MLKPARLQAGDLVAVLSPSCGAACDFPHIFDHGLQILKEFGLIVKEYPSTRANSKWLAKNPKARAKDINDAFADPQVKAIIASIGGDDSIRILPYLDAEIIAAHPKVIMGYSDFSTIHLFCSAIVGMVSFHGPSVMAGLAQTNDLPIAFKEHLKTMLFEKLEHYEYQTYREFSDGYLPWKHVENVGKMKEMKRDNGWRRLQGSGIVQGRLFGGCIEVLDWMRGTGFWPNLEFWENRILFLETSEECPSVIQVVRYLRCLGMIGIFDKISAILFGRARNYSDNEKIALDEAICSVIGEEFERPDLPVISNMDFGHTDPQFILPLGISATIDCDKLSFSLNESWFAE